MREEHVGLDGTEKSDRFGHEKTPPSLRWKG